MPPAFVLSQDQTLHKNYFNNSRCQFLFKKNRFSSISLCDLNYIQIQCKLSGYIALFNFQTTLSYLQLIVYQLAQSCDCSVMFNLAQFWDLSNLILNFSQTFLFQPRRNTFQHFAAWDLIYHSFEICQILFWTFSQTFLSAPRSTPFGVSQRDV